MVRQRSSQVDKAAAAEKVRQGRAWNRARTTSGRWLVARHHFGKEGQEGDKVPDQGLAVSLHERCAARTQAEDASWT